ncbi:unnamed protein product [Linum trigynum]|uniref:PB1-like domain-containing protein n=1 Tax=Linum trigynum TaxID=586398 RepID=A0AAV2GTC6_9ROSI
MLDTSKAVPKYVGGVEDRVDMAVDDMSYFELLSILIPDFDYLSVEKMWYLTPGQSMEDGLQEIANDSDMMNGLLGDAELGEVVVFFEATKFLGEMGDNYENSEDVADEEGDNSGVAEFIRLDDYEAQTSDEEYHEIRARFRRMRQKCMFEATRSGEEVDLVFVDENEVEQSVQQEDGELEHEQLDVQPTVNEEENAGGTANI